MANVQEYRDKQGRKRFRASLNLDPDPETGRPRLRPTKRCRTRKEAWAWIADTEAALSAGPRQARASLRTEATVADLLRHYAREVTEHKRSRDTEVPRLLRWCRHPIGERRCLTLTLDDHAELRRELEEDRRLAPNSVRKELGFVAGAVRWGVPRGYFEFDPFSGATMPRPGKARRRMPTDAELGLLIDASGLASDGPPIGPGQTAVLAYLIACETAMREGELAAMLAEDVDAKHSVVELRPEMTKSGEGRVVPLSPAALSLILRCASLAPDPGPVLGGISAVDISRAFARVRDRAGLPNEREAGGLTFHDGRHRGFTRLASWLSSPYDVAAAVGHNSLNEAMTYFEADARKMALTIAAVGVGPGVTPPPGVGTEEDQLAIPL